MSYLRVKGSRVEAVWDRSRHVFALEPCWQLTSTATVVLWMDAMPFCLWIVASVRVCKVINWVAKISCVLILFPSRNYFLRFTLSEFVNLDFAYLMLNTLSVYYTPSFRDSRVRCVWSRESLLYIWL